MKIGVVLKKTVAGGNGSFAKIGTVTYRALMGDVGEVLPYFAYFLTDLGEVSC